MFDISMGSVIVDGEVSVGPETVGFDYSRYRV